MAIKLDLLEVENIYNKDGEQTINLTGDQGVVISGNVALDPSANSDVSIHMHTNSGALGDAYAWNLIAESSADNYEFTIAQGTTDVLKFNNTAAAGNNNATFASDVAMQQTGDVYLTLESTSGSTTEEVAIKYSNQSTGSNYWWAGLNQSANYSLAYGTAYSGANVKMEISTVGGATFSGAGTFNTTLNVNAADEGGSPAMTAVTNMRGYEGRGVGIKMRDSVNSASSPSNREWFVGTGYGQSGFNIGYASDGSQSSYSAQAKLQIGTNGNAVFAGDISTSSGKLNITSDGSAANGAEIYLKHDNNNTNDTIGTIIFGSNADDTLSTIVSETSGANNTSNLKFTTSNAGTLATALTLNADNSATFADKVYIKSSSNYIDTIGSYLSFKSGGNEMTFGGSTSMYINYRAALGGTPVQWIWNAGTSSSYAKFILGELDVRSDAVFAGSLTIPDYINHTSDSGTKFGFSANDTFVVRTGGAVRLTVNDTSATFASQVDTQTLTIDGSSLGSYHDFQSKPIDSDSGLFTVGGHGEAGGYSRAVSLFTSHDGVWNSWVGTNLRWDGTNFKRASDAANNNWGNIAGIRFLGNGAASGAAMQFIIDPPDQSSNPSGEQTIGTSLPSSMTALSINNDLSATFASTVSATDFTASNSVTAGAFLKFGTNGNSDVVNVGSGDIRFLPSSQTLALTLSGANATFAGNVTLSNTAPIFYLDNTTSSTGKKWRLSSAANGKMYITQDGVIDAITLDHTTGNATFAGSISVGGHAVNDILVAGDTFANDDSHLMTAAAIEDKILSYGYGTGGGSGNGDMLLGTVQDITADKEFQDGIKARFGTGADLQFYHASSESHIYNQTGNLTISNDATDGDIVFKSDNGTNGLDSYMTIDGGDGIVRVHKPLWITEYITHIGDNNTYFGFSAADTFVVHAGATGHAELTIDSTTATFAGDLKLFKTAPTLLIEGDGVTSANLKFKTNTVDRWNINVPSGQTNLAFTTGSTNVLSLDTSNNATFAGDLQVDGGDMTIVKQNGSPTINMLRDSNDPGSGTLLHYLNFQVDYGGSHQDWGGIEHRTTTSATRTKLNFNVKSTSGSVLNALSLDGTTDGTTATFAGNINFGDSHFIGDDADDNLLIQGSSSENVIVRSEDGLYFRTGGDNTRLTINSSGAATFAGDVTLSSTAPTFYLDNTTSSTGKNWRLSSAANGKMYIAEHGVVDAITLEHTTGNATFAGSITIPEALKATNGNLKFYAGGTHVFNVDVNKNIYPQTHNSTDLGFSSTLAFRQLWLSGDINTSGELIINNNATNNDGGIHIKNDTDAYGGGITFWTEYGGTDTNIARVQGGTNGSNGILYLQTANTSKVLTTALSLDYNQDASFKGDVNLLNNKKLEVGTNGYGKFFNDGSHTYIENYAGEINFRQFTADGAMIFHADNSTGGGNITEYFRVDGENSRVKFSVNTLHLDNIKALFGNSTDLQIYHNGSNDRSYIYNGTGDLYIENDATDGDIKFYSDDGSGGTAQYFRLDGSEVETGFLKTTHHYDNVQARFGDSGDLRIYHSGTHSYVDGNNVGDLYIRSLNDDVVIQAADDVFIYAQGGEDAIIARGNGAVELYHNNAKKIETTAYGAKTYYTATSNTDGDAAGDIAYLGETTTVAGKIYYYTSSGAWELTDADAESTAKGMLGVALGTSSGTSGMLLKGMVTLDHDPGTIADTLFLSTSAGAATATAPSGTGDIVRVIGYCLNSTNGQIYFNPDGAFVEVTAG